MGLRIVMGVGPFRVSAGTSRRRRSSGGGGAAIFGLLVVVGLIIKFWVWILLAALLWFLIWFGLQTGKLFRAQREEAERQTAALIARVDAEHNALMNGDTETGVYGQFQPPPSCARLSA